MAANTLGMRAVDEIGDIASPPGRLVERHDGMKRILLENTSDLEAVEAFESAAVSRRCTQAVNELIYAVDAVELAEDVGERR